MRILQKAQWIKSKRLADKQRWCFVFKTLRNAWSVPEIRKKLLYTLLMILIFRMGCAVVVPFLDTSMVTSWMDEKATGGNFLEYLDIITGGHCLKRRCSPCPLPRISTHPSSCSVWLMRCRLWSDSVTRAKKDRKNWTKSQRPFHWHYLLSCLMHIMWHWKIRWVLSMTAVLPQRMSSLDS